LREDLLPRSPAGFGALTRGNSGSPRLRPAPAPGSCSTPTRRISDGRRSRE
ncbi:unnamed protein product, partial [Polarella glacialis]